MSRSTAAVTVLGTILLATACSSDDATPAVGHSGTQTVPASAYDFFDPCDEQMTAWFAEHGFTHPEHIDPLLDENGSGCSYDRADTGVALLSRPSTPGDAVDVRVHQLLGLQGPVYPSTVVGHPAKVELITAGRKRQDCHLLVRVAYGFLEFRGGPRGKLAPSYPRDCDAVLTFAEMLTREVDARWQSDD